MAHAAIADDVTAFKVDWRISWWGTSQLETETDSPDGIAVSIQCACRGSYRETLEDTFEFDNKTLVILAATLIGFPLFLYKGMTKEFSLSDDTAGR